MLSDDDRADAAVLSDEEFAEFVVERADERISAELVEVDRAVDACAAATIDAEFDVLVETDATVDAATLTAAELIDAEVLSCVERAEEALTAVDNAVLWYSPDGP